MLPSCDGLGAVAGRLRTLLGEVGHADGDRRPGRAGGRAPDRRGDGPLPGVPPAPPLTAVSLSRKMRMLKKPYVLRRHGYHIGPGTLYPILHELEASGYVRSENSVADGKVRKYYRITASGRRILTQAKNKIRELTEEVLSERSSGVNAPGS